MQAIKQTEPGISKDRIETDAASAYHVGMIPAEIEATLKEKELTLALLVRAGSKSYGIDVEESDDDYVGVFTAPLRRFASIYGLELDTWAIHKPDATLHEIGKFCHLALKGNPAVLETLWNPEILHRHPAGEELIGLRRGFLHRGSLEVYIAYAEAQMKKMVKGKPLHSKGGAYNGKYGAHLIRLLHAGIGLAERQEVTVRVDAEQARALIRIRRMEISMGEVLNLARPLLERLRKLSAENSLPERPEFDRINDLVVRARLAS
jgi:predicted nucleotidyltransferase